MATHVETITHYTDDIDGGKAEGTIAFSFDGTSYEIDLSKKNRAAFEKVLAPYVKAARKTRATRGRAPATKRSSAAGRERLQAIREWAKAQGIDIAERGRISQDVQNQYDAAH